MSRYLIILSLAIFFYACDVEDPKETQPNAPTSAGVSGFVQKGPFVSGSNIIIQILDADFNPTGQSYTVTTIDDFGSFVLESTISGEYAEFIAQGFYFNEVSGEISNASLSLRALAKISPDMKSNVNILTTLSKNRIIQLVKQDHKSFDDAKAQAEAEILGIFNISANNLSDFNTMDIREAGERHAMLLAISSILQADLSVGELSELISKIILDVQDNGTVDNNTLLQQLNENAQLINLADVKENLLTRYAALGISHPVPEFEKFAKRLVPITVTATIPVNNAAQVRYDISHMDVFFNKALDASSVNSTSVKVHTGAGVPVEGEVTYDADSFKIEFRPNVALLPEQIYTLLISEDVKTLDGTAFPDFSLSFSTINIDVTSNLLAYFPFDGNTNDATGHGFNSEGVNVSFAGGISNDACKLNGQGSYVEIPNVLNPTQKVWTYSIWFKVDEFDLAVGPFLLATRLSASTWWDIPLYVSPSRKSVVTYNESFLLTGGENSVSAGTWHHAAIVINNGTVKVYADGSLKSTGNNLWSHQSNPGYTDFLGDATGSYEYYTGKFYISEKFRGENWPGYMKGSVDNVRFYDRALNEYEIQKLFTGKL